MEGNGFEPIAKGSRGQRRDHAAPRLKSEEAQPWWRSRANDLRGPGHEVYTLGLWAAGFEPAILEGGGFKDRCVFRFATPT